VETFRLVLSERKRREMDPAIARLENCAREAKAGDHADEYLLEQLSKMLEFIRLVTTWYEYLDNFSTPAMLRLFRGGPLLAKLLTRGKPGAAVAGSESAEASFTSN
jgi:hypothetical protein